MAETPPKDFIALSSLLTGFTKATLIFALQAADFYSAFVQAYSKETADNLLAFYSVKSASGASPDQIAEAILSDKTLKDPARALMVFWYTGQIGTADNPDAKTIPGANFYAQGLAWQAIQAHPTGVSHLDFGYWASPPPPLKDFL